MSGTAPAELTPLAAAQAVVAALVALRPDARTASDVALMNALELAIAAAGAAVAGLQDTTQAQAQN